MPAFEAAPARSNIAVLKPAYSKSISHSRLPSSRKLAGSRSLWPKTIGSAHLRPLQLVGQRQTGGQGVRHAAVAGLERARIVADDVEHPEHEAGARDVLRHLVVEAADQRGDAADIGAHVVGAIGLRAEKGGHHDARLGIVHFRREAGRVRGARRHDLALAEDVVERIVLAEAHDMPAGAVA